MNNKGKFAITTKNVIITGIFTIIATIIPIMCSRSGNKITTTGNNNKSTMGNDSPIVNGDYVKGDTNYFMIPIIAPKKEVHNNENTVHESQIILDENTRFSDMEGENITFLVRRIVNLINECRKSRNNILAIVKEYNIITSNIQERFHRDPLMNYSAAGMPTYSYGLPQIDREKQDKEIRENIETHLMEIYSYLSDKYSKV